MKLLKKIKSRQDNTIKYIFQINTGQIIELSYINKNDGKDIICVPSQTGCNLGCKFCHITNINDKLLTRNIEYADLFDSVEYVREDLNLNQYNRMLLISFMGCGEPILNYENIIAYMITLTCELKDKVRFGVATSIPKTNWINFYKFTNLIQKNNLNVKMHLSLHYTKDEDREKWMPAALPIKESINALHFYQLVTGNKTEVHYALIDGVNDNNIDAKCLAHLLKEKNIPVKFLFYNENPDIDFHKASLDKIHDSFKLYMEAFNIEWEYYTPPGLDVGASCGQFHTDYYLKYNSK